MLSLFNELKTQNNKNYKYLLPATVSAIFLVIIISISRSNSDGNSGNPVNVSISSYDGIFEDLGIENLILDGSESEVIENPIAIKYSDNLIFETPGLELEGNNIDKVTHAPIEIKFSNRKADTFYTILMLDTDAPSRQNNTASPWLHWLIINLQGASTDIGLLKTGQTITSYHAPTPPANSGWHRYTFLVFEQENKVTSEMIEVSLQPVIAKRNNFDLLKFLEIVPGEIVGVEMFRTEKFENKTIIGRAESTKLLYIRVSTLLKKHKKNPTSPLISTSSNQANFTEILSSTSVSKNHPKISDQSKKQKIQENLKLLNLPIIYKNLSILSHGEAITLLNENVLEVVRKLKYWLSFEFPEQVQQVFRESEQPGDGQNELRSSCLEEEEAKEELHKGIHLNALLNRPGANSERDREILITAEDFDVGSPSTEASDHKASSLTTTVDRERTNTIEPAISADSNQEDNFGKTFQKVRNQNHSGSDRNHNKDDDLLNSLIENSSSNKRLTYNTPFNLSTGLTASYQNYSVPVTHHAHAHAGQSHHHQHHFTKQTSTNKYTDEEFKNEEDYYPRYSQEIESIKSKCHLLQIQNEKLENKLAKYEELVRDYPLYYDPDERIFKNCKNSSEKVKKVNKRLARGRRMKEKEADRANKADQTSKANNANRSSKSNDTNLTNDTLHITNTTTTSLMSTCKKPQPQRLTGPQSTTQTRTQTVGNQAHPARLQIKSGPAALTSNNNQDDTIVADLNLNGEENENELRREIFKLRKGIETKDVQLDKLKKKIRENEGRLMDHKVLGL